MAKKIPTGLDSLNSSKSSPGVSEQILAVRVKFVLLNGEKTPTTWKEFGEYLGMGGILFEEINNPGTSDLESLSYAAPLYSNLNLFQQ